jgi:hypothetical protein
MIEFERFRRKWSWPNVRYYPGICVVGLKNTIKSFSDNSCCPGQDPNWIYPHYKLKVISAWAYHHNYQPFLHSTLTLQHSIPALGTFHQFHILHVIMSVHIEYHDAQLWWVLVGKGGVAMQGIEHLFQGDLIIVLYVHSIEMHGTVV